MQRPDRGEQSKVLNQLAVGSLVLLSGIQFRKKNAQTLK